VCKLWLPPHGLHADLNGDGVLDHAIAVSDDAHQHAGHHKHEHLLPCHGYVFSGYPPTAPLFNGTICRSARGLTAGLGGLHGDPARGAPLETVPPVALRAPARAGGGYAAGGSAGDHAAPALAVWLNSRGELVAYDGHGGRRWMRQTAATWVNLQEDALGARVAPTLKPLPFFTHAVPSAVLAAGARAHACLLRVSDTRAPLLLRLVRL
jgi:hypothetical protein